MDNLIFTMSIFAFVGAVTPGPVNIVAISTAVNYGVRAAVMHVVGASVAYALVVLLSGSVMYSVALILPKLEWTMQVLGSVFLIHLAYKISRVQVDSFHSSNRSKSGFWMGSFIQVVNPKAWLVAMSGASLFVVGQADEKSALVIFTLVSLFICLIGVGIWALIGRGFAKVLENPLRQKRFNQVMAALLSGSVVLIWL